MEHEVEIIENFFKSNKKGRAKELLVTAKKRKKLLNEFSHGNLFEDKYIVSIKREKQNPNDIYNCLKANGAEETCFVISENLNIDGKSLDLKKVLKEIVGYGMGTIIYCKSTETAYFEGEG
ncbi:hypothetical protein EYV94_27995 [Puteibacter caeruleilacunae]|nr:hypothetical protein EYV94_27995 [Puteibacter caeruleilacunae]